MFESSKIDHDNLFFVLVEMDILNYQGAFNNEINEGREPKLSTLLRGSPLICDLYCKRYDMEQVDCTSDETISDFCFNIYREKVGFTLKFYPFSTCLNSGF